ncbi:hypothetical protein ABN028_10865 [Actinopolymorpha sp. B17G11]|uniref:hypothetical protein n=1 Tax=Actinopolymorpha sp. B17G11 TaxID=3160861 RepID=UPI0032E51D4C
MGKKEWSYDDMEAAMKKWYVVSDDIDEVVKALNNAKFTMLEMGLAAPVQPSYEDVRSSLRTLLKDAARETASMGAALRKTNGTYMESEEWNKDAIADAAKAVGD